MQQGTTTAADVIVKYSPPEYTKFDKAPETAGATELRVISVTPSTTDSESSPLKSNNTKSPKKSSTAKYLLALVGISIIALAIFIFSVRSDGKNEDMKEEETHTVPIYTTVETPDTQQQSGDADDKSALSFFGKTGNSFGSVAFNKDGDSGEKTKRNIDAQQFLVACTDYLTIYRLLGNGFTFDKITNDVKGNIKKLENWRTATNKQNLFDIIQAEIDAQTTTASGSATDALLWLKRGLWLMYYFFNEVVESNASVPAKTAFTNAYNRALAPHHFFGVKFIIRTGIKSTNISVDDFVRKVCEYKIQGDVATSQTCNSITDIAEKRAVVLGEIKTYIGEMHTLLLLIDEFYNQKVPQ